MKAIIDKNRNPSVAQSVSDLVAEGGNVLASDEATIAANQAPLETTIPANTGQPTSQIRMDSGSQAAPSRILRRPGVQRRATLHLPSPPAFTQESKPGGQAAPGRASQRPGIRMTLGRLRPANGSS
jgi:hypothetical protein